MTMSKREALRVKRRKSQQRQRTILIVGVIVVVIAAAAILILPNLLASMAPVGSIVQITPNPRPNANGLSMGDPNAPIKVQEFADFQCPYCKKFALEYEPKLIQDYITTGKVYYTFVPDSFIGQESLNAAEAAYCANDQGKFWEYHDLLYANQTSENSGDFSDARLKAFARTLGLDTGKFNTCYDNHKYKDQVQQDITTADKYKVTETPSFTVNDKLISLNQMTDLETAIASALGTKTP